MKFVLKSFEMGVTIVIFSVMFAAASATTVNLASQWKPEVGWEITCSWRLYANDSLQSVRLWDYERQFLIYRPEVHGPKYDHHFPLTGKTLLVECYETFARGITGQCVMTLELYQPSSEDMNYACEVSGERPMFRMDKKDAQIIALVPPSDAVVEVAQRDSSGSRVVLNCTSSGVPPPNLVWTVGEQKVPHDFSGKTWNITSKLWNAWSLLSFSSDAPATCKPEISKSGTTAEGGSAIYSAASGSRDGLGIFTAVITALALTR